MKEAEVRSRAEPGKKGEVWERHSDFYSDIQFLVTLLCFIGNKVISPV